MFLDTCLTVVYYEMLAAWNSERDNIELVYNKHVIFDPPLFLNHIVTDGKKPLLFTDFIASGLEK
jgi:hypothetical protein